jgi:hypothetical protein
MDPNATLKRIREISKRITGILDSEYIHAGNEMLDLASELAELTTALDEWLSKGGFFPRDWTPF